MSSFTPNASSWLKLHELTRQDMIRVVQDEFHNDERFVEVRRISDEYDELITSIVNKADGVLLWVHLAMRSLLTGIGNCCSSTQLQRKLDALPDELNAMFRQMFEKVERSERQRAAQTFLTMKVDAADFPHYTQAGGSTFKRSWTTLWTTLAMRRPFLKGSWAHS